jgi:lysophospholipase L1-like esterase
MKKVLTLGLTFLLIELSLFLVKSKLGNYEAVRLSLLNEDDGAKYISQPYLNYINRPGSSDNRSIVEINEFGFRHTDSMTFSKNEGRYRVVFIGGSTTYGEGIESLKQVFIGQLANDYCFKKTELINAGLGGATSAELLTAYMLKLQYLRPDLLVIRVGANDALIHTPLAKYQPDYHNSRRVFPEIEPLNKKLHIFLHSRIFSYSIINLFYGFFVSNHDYKDNACTKLNNDYLWFPYNEDSSFVYRYNALYNNIKSLIYLAQKNHTNVLLIPELYNYNYIDSLVSANYLPKNIGKGFINASMFYNKVVKDVAIETGVSFCSVDTGLFPSTMFFDFCHLTVEGNKRLADQIKPCLCKNISNY